MYTISVFCDECGKLITDEFTDKSKACDFIRKTHGYCHMGIHLCSNCNLIDIRKKHLHKKKNLWD